MALRGTGESVPIDTSSVDVVLASSSWHWMEPDQTLHEAARVLVPGGTLGVVWTGPDPEGPFITQAQTMLGEMSSGSMEPITGPGGDLDPTGPQSNDQSCPASDVSDASESKPGVIAA